MLCVCVDWMRRRGCGARATHSAAEKLHAAGVPLVLCVRATLAHNTRLKQLVLHAIGPTVAMAHEQKLDGAELAQFLRDRLEAPSCLGSADFRVDAVGSAAHEDRYQNPWARDSTSDGGK